MILGFNRQFVQPILSGKKIHTIREDKNNRWKAGRSIQMAIGVRTKSYFKFHDANCINTQAIEINYFESIFPGDRCIQIKVDNKVLNYAEMVELSRRDGFETLGDLMEWFDDDFIGKIIHWTDIKY